MTVLLDEPRTGVTDGTISRLRRESDAAYARFFLGVADEVQRVHDSDHPDLQLLQERGVTITGLGADRTIATLDLLAEEFSRHENMPLDNAHATIHDAFRKGTDSHTLWQAVADQRISLYQARTIERQADRLAARVAVVREITDEGGNTTLLAEEGDRLFDGEDYRRVLDEFLHVAVTHAEAGFTGAKLKYRCDKKITALTPGYEPVVLEKREDTTGLHITPCDDGLHAHVAFVTTLDAAVELKTFATAAADACADHAKRNGLGDTRTHGQRECDVVTDLLRDGLTRQVPALSDPTEPATDDTPVPVGRTHKPRSSVQTHVHIDATTLFGIDDHPAWVDGLGSVPAHTARELATSTGATWRAVITAPGTRAVLDVAAERYEITATMRRFITARDQTCVAPGCQVPAIDCDLDHVIAWPEGKTTENNLRAYCRSHHRFKTQNVWEASRGQRERLGRGRPPTPEIPDEPPF